VIDREGVIHLVVQGTNDALYENLLKEQEWQGWRKVTRGRGNSGPVVVADAEGKIWLFIYGPDRRVWYSLEEEEEGKSAWQPMSGQPEVAGFTVLRDVQGHLLLLTLGLDKALWQNMFIRGSWQGWEPFVASGPLPENRPFSAELSGVLGSEGKVWLFAGAAQGEVLSLPYFVLKARGHVMSLYPVTVPVVITPLYLPLIWVFSAHRLSFVNPNPPYLASKLAEVMEKLSASLIASLSALFVYLVLGELCERRTAFWLAILYALGTNTWTIGSQALWQHGMSELTLSLMVFALLRAAGDERFLVWAGLGAALATANRPPNILFALLALAYVWQYHSRRTLLFLPFPIVIASLLLAYNLYYFGTLLGGYSGAASWSSSWYEGLLGELLSPSRGLFIYTPVTLFSLWGMGLLWQKLLFPHAPSATPLLRYMSLGVCGQVLLYAKWSNWWGGHCFGPRLLTDILPFLSLFLPPALGQIAGRKPFQIAFCVAAVLSVSVQIVGAFFYTGQWDPDVDLHPELLWDWRNTQILHSLKAGPASMPYLQQILEALRKAL
jgi:hypothetical protein